MRLRILLIVSIFLLVLPVAAQQSSERGRLRFRVTLPAGGPVSGRLLVLMTDNPNQRYPLGVGFVPGSTWVSAMEVEYLPAGGAIEFDPDTVSYPKPFSKAKAGAWQMMAVLDTDHTYAYHGLDGGDLTSEITKIESLDPLDALPVELALTRKVPARAQPGDSDRIKLVTLQSRLLSEFWGRPIMMRAGVVLPPDYTPTGTGKYAGVYHIHGFGGDHTGAWRQGSQIINEIGEGLQAPMIHIYLDGSFPTGHHEFADSVNNGPWGRALTEEFIPHLEKIFRLEPHDWGRFLTGHSSGGWSTLWLQVTYPDFFGGTWSTAPDPVDLRSWTGIDVTPGSTDNAYRNGDGTAKQLVRRDGKWIVSIEEFARQEAVLGDFGGQFASFEWVWSPRDIDGRPMRIFNRQSGELNQEVARYWQRYDIRLILQRDWARLGPKLKGKINVICGDADTFRLDEAVKMLCSFLKDAGSDAVCELVPGRDHGNLYQPYETFPRGLAARIYTEMAASYKAHAK